MQKIILSTQQIHELVASNRYKVHPDTKSLSRCIDGRYENSDSLPALAIPGADLGEIMVVLAAGNDYGFDVDAEKTVKVLTEIVGGMKNLSFHTDSHANPKQAAAGCGHVKQALLDPEAYKLRSKQVSFIQNLSNKLRESGANETKLHGEHEEGAVLMIEGNYGIMPQYMVETDAGQKKAEVFIFHRTLTDQRRRLFANKLVENNAVKLYNGCDAEYLYEVLSNMTDEHLFETSTKLAKGLPIYGIIFDENGGFKVKEMETVE